MKKGFLIIGILIIIGAVYFLLPSSGQKNDTIQKNVSEQTNRKYIDFKYKDLSTGKEDKVIISVDESLLGSKTFDQIELPQSGIEQEVYIGGDTTLASYDKATHTWSSGYTTFKTSNGLVVHKVGENDGGYVGESYLIEIPNENIWLRISAGYDGTSVHDFGKTDDPEYKEFLKVLPLIESIQIIK
jgi:hypothetical protein